MDIKTFFGYAKETDRTEMYLNKAMIEEMKVGAFSNKSYFGYKGSVLKSGICKYYRRKYFEKFEWCVIEMMLFGLLSKGLLTNVLNRMKILLMEEIICNEGGRLYESVVLLENMEKVNLKEKIGKMLEICDIVKDCKRGRIVSYMNNWWKYNNKEYVLNDVEMKEVIKYKKEGDSDELLKYGELFIRFIKEKNENMFGILHKIYDMKGGNRYRRKDGVYLFITIIEDMFDNKKFLKIVEFARIMIYKTNMKERRAFCVWLLMMVWKYDDIVFDKIEWVKRDVKKYLEKREKINIYEDFVINDFHVNKNFSLEKFGKVGAFVEDEDLSLLEYGEEYRNFYVKMKKDVKKEEVDVNEFIEWKKFEDVKVLEDGVCGLKVCCIKVKYEGKTYIMKEMRKSFNNGRDYMFVDVMKEEFGLKNLGMKLIRSNVGLEVIDKKIRSLVKNWIFCERDVIYSMMDYFENIGDIGKNKKFLEKDDVFKECLKIRLYDGLFRSSDNIMRNILVNKDGDVMSIDENDIYGKRLKIFGKNDFYINRNNIDKSRVVSEEILNEWKIENKIDIVEKKMKSFGFDDKIIEMKERFVNYKNIVMSEL